MTSGDVESGSADQDSKDHVDEEIENENSNEDAESPVASDVDDEPADQADQGRAEGESANLVARSAAPTAGQADQDRTDSETQTENASQAEKSHVGGYKQAIGAEYFNITDAEDWPIAGLLVLLDGMYHPVRAELQFYEDLREDIEGAAVRQAQSILQRKYTSKDPLPLRFVLSVQAPEVMDVRLRPPGSQPRKSQSKYWMPVIMALASVVVIIALVWIGVTILGSFGSETPVAEVVPIEPTVENVGLAGETDSGGPVDASSATSTPDLPQSKNARPDVAIGVRARILPGLKLTLRSEAGPTAGEEIGFMTDAEEALVIGGPVYTRGTSDTIVWWFVRLDDGTEAWAAANTSNQTLLEPVP